MATTAAAGEWTSSPTPVATQGETPGSAGGLSIPPIAGAVVSFWLRARNPEAVGRLGDAVT
jgi:hypothetical protein